MITARLERLKRLSNAMTSFTSDFRDESVGTPVRAVKIMRDRLTTTVSKIAEYERTVVIDKEQLK
ncbi:hypothetical protein ATN79_48095 [Paraburkholderia caribensis]|nr:hypothetical protein ATN79_48095 [Paraburkholderia caribensis]